VALSNGTNLRYVHQDSLGSTSVVTDSAGAQYGYTRYYPYGSTRDSGGSLDTSKKFTGQRLDASGLYYYGARYYDPVIGRFISADTIVSSAPLPNGERISALTVSYHIEKHSPYTSGGAPRVMDPQELNRYSYALNNPLRYTDPQGNQVDLAQALIQTGLPVLIAIGTGLLMAYNLSQSYNQQQTGFSIGSVVTGVVNTGVAVVKTVGDVVSTTYDKATGYLFSKHGGQSDKKLRKSIESEAKNVKDHEDKLKENPNSQDSKPWRDHAAKAMKNIKDALDDMGPNARQKALDYLREQGIEFNYGGCPKG
jgi:RHS repeat-associated protein